MTRALYLLGLWCARRAVAVIAAWLVLLGAAVLADRILPPPALDPFVLAGTESASAATLLIRAFPGAASEAVPLVVGDDVDLASGAGRQMLAAVSDAVAGVVGVNAVRTPEDSAQLLGVDGRTAIVQLTMAERSAADADVGEEVLEAARAAAAAHSSTARIALGGYLGQQVSRTDTRTSEALGLLLAVLVLLATLRRAWPVAVPLATALVAVGIGLSAIGLLGRLVHIPDEAPTLGTMLGLGVGIDYALFLLTRHRTLLRRGFAVDAAIGRTAGTAGAGMVFAGATLLAAVCGLTLTGISFLAWLGYSAAIVVALALLAALTLVPAMLALLGTRALPAAAERARAARQLAGADHSDAALDAGAWARIATTVTAHPWRWTVAATALLLVMAAPMLSMRFQQVDATALPDDTPAHIAQDMITEAFGPGWTGPLAIVGQLHRPATAPAADEPAGDEPAPGDEPPGDEPADPRTRDPRIVAISAEVLRTPGIAELGDPVVSTDGGVVLWRATPTTGPSDPATEALVLRMRTEVLPDLVDGADMAAFVGGVTAARTDLSLRIAERLLPFVVGVASLSFLLLLLAYRSLVIPAKAAVMNLVSISAAYGLVVAVFQWGWGARWIGLDGPVPIESYVPMMMFAILFGLSMDYEIFLLTAFSEHYQRTGDIVTAIRRGLADTGQLITAAALIMVAVFVSFVIPDNAIVKMFGVGLATAVLVDATVVRCVLVPSLMVLAARWTWWLPGWLDRALPRLHVEGDPAQLDSIHQPAQVRPQDSQPAAGVGALALGAVTGWLAGGLATADAEATPAAGAALAVAAVGGALIATLPRAARGAGGPLGTRLLAMLLGALSSAAVHALLSGLTPAVHRNPAVQAGLALLVPLGIASLPALRAAALPIGLGAVAMTAALAAVGGGFPLGTVALPTVVAVLATRAMSGVVGSTGRLREVREVLP